MNTSKNRQLCLQAYWLFAILYWEILSHGAMYGQFHSSFLFALGFSAAAALALGALVGLLPQKALRPVSAALSVVIMVLYGSQMVYYFIFGTPYSVSQIGLGADAMTSFWREMLACILGHLLWLLALLVPLVLLALLHGRRAPQKPRPAYTLGGLVLAPVLALAVWAAICCGGTGMYSNHYFFTDSGSTTSQTMERFGMPATFLLECVRPKHDSLLSDDLPLSMDLVLDKGAEPTKEATATQPIRETEDSVIPEEEPTYAYNALDIDFEKLADEAEDDRLAALHRYFTQIPPTKQNEYTGKFRDYNLIVICAESFSPAALDPEITPTLYKLAHEGFVFNNYYNSFPNTTTNGEYALMQGLYPDSTLDKYHSSMLASAKNTLPFVLGNAFSQQLGIVSRGYHNYTADYYSRHTTHANMGYEMKFNHAGMELSNTWPNSDLEMMEASVDDYIHDPQFHAYYMTFSGHYQYNPDTNAMVAKNFDRVKDLPGYNTIQKGYLSCHIELDKAMEYLLRRLEEAGIADKTVIVLTSDHYPYGIPEDDYFDMLNEPKDEFEKYKSTLIFWVGGMEPVEVNEYCCNVDILPTLLNLWGLEYDSRLLSGTDIFSDSLHMAVLIDRSFLTDAVRFNSNRGQIQYQVDESLVPEGYVDSINKLISTRFTLAKEIVRYNYYDVLFPES